MKDNPTSRPRLRWKFLAITLAVAAGSVAVLVPFIGGLDSGPVAEVKLEDGRLLQIEAVTYGTNVILGRRSFVNDWFGRWLPPKVTEFFQPTRPQTRWTSKEPRFVVWLNAYDPEKPRYVDCQGFRLGFVDEHGVFFPGGRTAWYGFGRFFRVAHEFEAYPRRMETLHLKVASRSSLTPEPTYYDVEKIAPEIVLLVPRQTEFTVRMPAP